MIGPVASQLVFLRLTNFKSFKDTGNVPLAPLTLIFGRNNSGKSSILNAIRLLSQTALGNQGARLNLHGPMFRAGSYRDLVFQHNTTKEIGVSFTLNSPSQIKGDRLKRHFRFELTYSADEPNPPRLATAELWSGKNAYQIKRGRGKGGPFEYLVGGKKVKIENRRGRSFDPDFVPLRAFFFSEGLHFAQNVQLRNLSTSLSILQRVRSLGAFRDTPERRYEFRGGDSGSVDALINDQLGRQRSSRRKITAEVNRWLRHIARAQLLPIRALAAGGRLFELRVKDTDARRWANYADVGFGISQALPVLVQGLLAEPGGVFLVEEPEIHLHPDAQLAMADFLVDLAQAGVQVVAETHSEQLLLRVRRRILEKKRVHGSKLEPADVSLLLVDKVSAGGSTIQPIAVDELGQLKNWPVGFLEDSTAERMALLGKLAEAAEQRT